MLEIIKKGITKNGDPIQIESWKRVASIDHQYETTVGVYPMAHETIQRYNFTNVPLVVRNRRFRVQIECSSKERAEEVFESLVSGKAGLIDYIEDFYDLKIAEVVKREASRCQKIRL